MTEMTQRSIITLFAILMAPIMATAELSIGDDAPNFKLVGSDGETYQLSELKGKTVVIAWFPKAFTGG